MRQVDGPLLGAQEQGACQVLPRRALRTRQHVLHHVRVARHEALGIARLEQAQLVKHGQRLGKALGGGALVHAIGRRHVSLGEHLCHGLVGHEHGLLDQAGGTCHLSHGDPRGLAALVEDHLGLARLEVDRPALAPEGPAQACDLVEKRDGLGHARGVIGRAGQLVGANLPRKQGVCRSVVESCVRADRRCHGA